MGFGSLFVFGIVLGPIAIYLGVMARDEIRQSDGRLSGEGRAKAAIILGAVATVIWIVVFILNLTVRS